MNKVTCMNTYNLRRGNFGSSENTVSFVVVLGLSVALVIMSSATLLSVVAGVTINGTTADTNVGLLWELSRGDLLEVCTSINGQISPPALIHVVDIGGICFSGVIVAVEDKGFKDYLASRPPPVPFRITGAEDSRAGEEGRPIDLLAVRILSNSRHSVDIKGAAWCKGGGF